MSYVLKFCKPTKYTPRHVYKSTVRFKFERAYSYCYIEQIILMQQQTWHIYILFDFLFGWEIDKVVISVECALMKDEIYSRFKKKWLSQKQCSFNNLFCLKKASTTDLMRLG